MSLCPKCIKKSCFLASVTAWLFDIYLSKGRMKCLMQVAKFRRKEIINKNKLNCEGDISA